LAAVARSAGRCAEEDEEDDDGAGGGVFAPVSGLADTAGLAAVDGFAAEDAGAGFAAEGVGAGFAVEGVGVGFAAEGVSTGFATDGRAGADAVFTGDEGCAGGTDFAAGDVGGAAFCATAWPFTNGLGAVLRGIALPRDFASG
jgi:hypothetical protein